MHRIQKNLSPLAGARIWLSGALPESKQTTAQERENILNFIKQFARQVFEQGGYIIHGSHPSLTPTLLAEAARLQEQGGRKDLLTLAVSRLWSKNSSDVPIEQWRKSAIVYETPEANTRDESLDILRKWMVSRCDAIVVVGGKWWTSITGRSGIPLELNLAAERGLPCFLLGGLGGVAQTYVNNSPEILRYLKNGLTVEENRQLATITDVASLAEKVCGQLARLPLVRGRGNDGASFRILALDGGGLKGAFTAAVLATWEDQTKLRIVDHFDIVAGTSTGGLLAIGLGVNLSATEILDFYKTRGPTIFPITRLRGRIKHTIRHICRPKYLQETLFCELQKAYYKNGTPLSMVDSSCRLVIPAYHAVAGASHVFRTPHHPDLTGDRDIPVADVALATAAAPTYFSSAKIANMIAENKYFDGGVWANSPTMAAIIEATCFLQIPLERIEVLSVGTTEEAFSVREQTSSGVIGWLWKKRILDILMNAQQESSLKLSRYLIGEPRFLRVNVTTKPGSYSLDSPKEIGELASLGNHEASKPEIIGQIKSRFLNGVQAAPWQKF